MGTTNQNIKENPDLRGYPEYFMTGLVLLFLFLLPLFIPIYLLGVMTKAIIFAIFALSLNLLMGYSGLISMGHAAFFGVAAYSSSMIIVHGGIKSFWLVAPFGIMTAAVLAAVFGIIALRVTGIHFLFVTLALGQLLYSIAMKWSKMTGGSNGLVSTSYPDLGLSWLSMKGTAFYYMVLIVFIISYFLLSRLIKSPLGVAFQGIRESKGRMGALGYNTWLCRYIAFIVGGTFAGVAGVLFGYQSKVIVPMHLNVGTSTLVMLMVIIGSDRVFWGPALGAVIMVFLEHYISIYAPHRWPLILGCVFIAAVMFLRGGISIYLLKIWKRFLYARVKS